MRAKRMAPPMCMSAEVMYCDTISAGRPLWVVSARVASSGNCDVTMASPLLQGHTFTREPMMKPARTMRVSLCQRARSQWRNFEKPRIPTTAPTRNTQRIRKLLAKFPLKRPVMTPMMYSYLPRIRRMKLPEMPGRIIAQMAMAPLRKMNHSASGVWVGESVQTVTPRTTPPRTRSISRSFQPLIPRRMNIDDATMRPKKNAQVWIGWLSRRYCISPASESTLMPMPAIRARRNEPLMCFQKSLKRPRRSRRTASMLTDAMDPTNSSYIPVMKAIVPPDTPGITSAPPMHAPFTAISR